MADFPARLRQLREAAGLSQPKLAKLAGLSKGGIAHLEQGTRKPAWDTVMALCTALNVDCTAFADAAAPETPPRGRGRPVKAKPVAKRKSTKKQ